MTEATPPPGSPAPVGTTAMPTSEGSPAPGSTQPNGSAAPAPVTPPDIWAGLSPDNLNFVKGKNFSDLNAALSSYRELQTAFSSRPAAPEAPSDVAGYDWARPADADTIGYSDDFANAFKTGMLGGKIPKAAAQHVHDWFVGYAKTEAAKALEAQSSSITQSQVDLVRKWGPENSPTFTRNIELANRAMEQLGMADLAFKAGSLIKDKDGKQIVVDAKTVEAFSKIGSVMFAEDTLYGTAASAANPWEKGSENVTMQGRIFREDPQRARQMIMAAGRQSEFKHTLSKIPGA